MKIQNEKELQIILDSKISIPVYWSQNVDNTRVYIDEDSIREEFESQLKLIMEAVNNY